MSLLPVAEEQEKLSIDIEPSSSACCGAATAYILRRIAAAAGSYSPGIEETMFFELQRDRYGASLELVDRWFAAYQDQLSRLGYRFMVRRVAFRTPGISNWVAGGKGHRGAVLPTHGAKLHPDMNIDRRRHAVALHLEPGSGNLMMVDPLPGKGISVPPPDALEPAHRERKYAGLLVFWAGWS